MLNTTFTETNSLQHDKPDISGFVADQRFSHILHSVLVQMISSVKDFLPILFLLCFIEIGFLFFQLDPLLL